MAKDKVWYRQNWQEFEVVTDYDRNPELGIDLITLEPPTDAEYKKGIVCHVNLKMTHVDIRCHVLEDREEGSLSLELPSHVTMDKVIFAQVLRYVETQCETVE